MLVVITCGNSFSILFLSLLLSFVFLFFNNIYFLQVTCTLFVFLQFIGFYTLTKNGLPLQKNVSVSFLYILVGVHGLHVIGGIIALFVMFIKAFSNKVRSYDSIPIEVVSTYWHFVDFLWIYLLIFLILIR